MIRWLIVAMAETVGSSRVYFCLPPYTSKYDVELLFKPESKCLLKFTSADESLLYGSFLNSVLHFGVFWKTFGSFGIRKKA